MSNYFVGVTGASGHAYAERLIRALVAAGHEVDVALTKSGSKVLRHERGIDAGARGERLEGELVRWLGESVAPHVRSFASDEVEARASSGTHPLAGVIICPCSMGTLARIAAGYSSSLVERVADVAMKEQRELILVPRETPLSQLHLENLLRMSRLGAVILPAMPGFYHRPATLLDLVDHLVSKILDRLGVEHTLTARWAGHLDEDPGAEPEQ
jgi:flavin prenyltransferase